MTLLADLTVLLARSPEDVATEALTIVLQRSAVARAAVQRLIDSWSVGNPSGVVATWRAQVAAADDARTDMEGTSAAGELVAVLENKFWAGLTINQPATYLSRLPRNGVLVFVVPASRTPIIQFEIAERARQVGELSAQLTQAGETWLSPLISGRTLVVTGWPTVLSSIEQSLEAAQDYATLADVRQLQGLVSKMDREGFRPFSVTDLTGNAGRLVIQACSVVDQATSILVAARTADKRGLRASGGRGWYGQYMRVRGYGWQLMFSSDRWDRFGSSPVWLRIVSDSWKFPEQAAVVLRQYAGHTVGFEEARDAEWIGVWLPVRLAEGREEPYVVSDVVHQLTELANVLPPILSPVLEPPLPTG